MAPMTDHHDAGNGAPTDPDLLPIGRFARLAGLSIGALRHYDEIGLLTPAAVDPATGYRRYRRGQLERARIIARLRGIDVSLDETRSATWDRAFASEALARASRVAGDAPGTERWLAAARAAAAEIVDPRIATCC